MSTSIHDCDPLSPPSPLLNAACISRSFICARAVFSFCLSKFFSASSRLISLSDVDPRVAFCFCFDLPDALIEDFAASSVMLRFFVMEKST